MSQELAELIRDYSQVSQEKIEMSFVAKIQKFDGKKMTATIRPMLFSVGLSPDGEQVISQAPDMQNVPVELIYAGDGSFVRPWYTKGDFVSVRCYASDIDKPLKSNQRANSKRNRFQLSYCSVAKGIMPKGMAAPAAFDKEGVVFGKGSKYIWFDGSGTHVEGDLLVKGKVVATENIETDGTVVGKTDVKAGPAGISGTTHQHTETGGTTSPPLP